MKTSWRRLSSSSSEDVLVKTNIFVLAIRLQDVFKTFWRCLQDVFKTFCKDIFKMFSRRIIKLNYSCWQVFEKYCKDGYLHKDLPRSHFWEIYGQSTKFARVIKISQVLVYYFTTHLSTTSFSGVLTKAYLESGRTSTMKFFCGNTEHLEGANYFPKKSSSTGLKIGS